MAIALSAVFTQAGAANLVLDGSYVKIGVNETTGTLGSGGNTSPGILYDSTGAGAFNTSYDYLTPGSPFEGWSIRYNSTVNVYNNNAGITGLASGVLTSYNGVAYNGTTYDNRAVWTNTNHAGFDLTHDYRFNDNQQIVDISTSIVAKTAMTDLYFARFTDPDARAAAGDSSATDNVLGYGAIPTTNVVFSEATVSRYALGLYSAASSGVNTAITGWSNDPTVYYAGGTTYGSGVNYGTGDDVIGIGFYLPTLASGSTVTFSYSYIFGPSAFGAASTAVSEGAGGGTPGTVPGGGTLVDVGSATSAASSSSTPTVTGTSTTNIVTTSSSATPWASTFATTYAYATVHATPTVIDNRLVVSRDNTTTTTVTETQTRDVTTVTTTTPRTTTTYSDSSTTVADGTSSSTSATATETASLAVATPVTATQTASASVDTLNNAVALNIYSQEMNRADPLSRINVHGEKITRRASQAVDVDRNSWMWITGKSANGNENRSSGFEVGFERLVNDTTLVGVQYNKIDSKMTNVADGSGKFDTDVFSLYSVKKLGRWAVKPSVGYSRSDYETSRVITLGALDNFAAETYANKYSTNGKSYWADVQVIAPQVWKLTPYAGITVRKTELDSGVETGTEVTRLTYGKYSDTSSQPYVGARFDSATTERGLFYTVDGRVTKFNLADSYKYGETLTSVNTLVGYRLNARSQIYAGYQYQHASEYNNSIISVGGKLDF